MQRGKKTTLVLGFGAVATIAGSLWLCRGEILAWYRYQTVKKLLIPAEREAALRRVLGWQIYDVDGEIRYRFYEKDIEDETIDHVVVCPQPAGRPIFAIFFKDVHTRFVSSGRGSHFELIEGGGAILPVYIGWNVLEGEFKDINGDRIVEFVDSTEHEDVEPLARTLQVVPICPPLRPVLAVAYDKRKPTSAWAWELGPTDRPDVYDILLGPKSAATGRIEPAAVYRWSAERRDWIGPEGGYDQPFLRIRDGDEIWAALVRFAGNR